ncbi:hypothetical protein ElyMa_003427900 [Elysia marginata]|uniref:Sema domain-containing protein n=1 Tax=Elysia marginata TaxID=1093978 RepID=A0AAV4JSD3_9GAST|nr:hypothetical protein ElyMa_003427900 [Elysia marginata]
MFYTTVALARQGKDLVGGVVKLVTFDQVLCKVTEIGGGSRGLTAGPRLNCSARGLVSVVESRVTKYLLFYNLTPRPSFPPVGVHCYN